jgi:hypothetical protein
LRVLWFVIVFMIVVRVLPATWRLVTEGIVVLRSLSGTPAVLVAVVLGAAAVSAFAWRRRRRRTSTK